MVDLQWFLLSEVLFRLSLHPGNGLFLGIGSLDNPFCLIFQLSFSYFNVIVPPLKQKKVQLRQRRSLTSFLLNYKFLHFVRQVLAEERPDYIAEVGGQFILSLPREVPLSPPNPPYLCPTFNIYINSLVNLLDKNFSCGITIVQNRKGE